MLLKGHFHHVTSVSWSNDGTKLASGSFDKTVRSWDPAAGECLCCIPDYIMMMRSSEQVHESTWAL